MKVLDDYNQLLGKTIAFAHMAQFAKQITIATTDNEVLMATFEMDEYGEESNIRVYHEWHVLDAINKNEWLRLQLGILGIFDLSEWEKEQVERKRIERERRLKAQEEKDKKEYERLKTKFEKA